MSADPFREAWLARFGEEPDVVVPELAHLLAHRSVRKFSERPIEDDLLRVLIACAQSASTSSNLQLWSVISVDEPARRSAIAALCANQKQIVGASRFLAFVADHYRIRFASHRVGLGAEGLDYTEFFIAAIVDAALAAERLVCAAECMGIGACYIGALRNNPSGVAELLQLPEGVFGVFGLCLGWADPQDESEVKPRLKQRAVWFHETYDPSPPIEEYDQRMREFYVRQGMSGEFNWSARSGRRVDNHHLTGREVLKEWLASRGFCRR